MILGSKYYRLTSAYLTLQQYNIEIEKSSGNSHVANLELKGANEQLRSKVTNLQKKYGGGGGGGVEEAPVVVDSDVKVRKPATS